MSAQWYYSNDGQQQSGPVPEDQLRALIAQGRVKPEHLIWKDGLASWTRVDASELRAALPRSGASAPQPKASPSQPHKSSSPWIGIAIAVAALVVLAIAAIMAIPKLVRKSTPQIAVQASSQAAVEAPSPSAPAALISPQVPNQASGQTSGGMSVASTSGLKIEKRSIVDKSDKLDIRVDYPHTGIATIDNEIEAWARGEIEKTRKEYSDPDALHGSGWNLGINYIVERNDNILIAFVMDEASYTGGAHGFAHDVTFNYLMPDGHRVDLPDILDSKGLAVVSALAIADLKHQSQANDYGLPDDMIQAGAGPDWKNFRAFTVLPTELHLYFAPYQVGPYVSGPQEVHIPISKLQGLIRSDWRTPREAPATQLASSPAASSQSSASESPSFDCTKAGTFVEKEICGDPVLAKLDAALSKNWSAMNAANIGDAKRDLLLTQRAWMTERNQCADSACLQAVYRKRIDAICAYPVESGVHPDCIVADSIADTGSSKPIGASDWKLVLNENGAIITSQTLGATVYIGKSCDAQSPQFGAGRWQWNDSGWEVDVGQQRLSFLHSRPPVAPPDDAPTKCKSE